VQRRLETIDNVKVLMMLAVVLYHSCMFFTGSWFDGATPVYEASYLSIFDRWLNTFHVQTFAMASGFLFYCLRTEKGKYINFGKAVLKRCFEKRKETPAAIFLCNVNMGYSILCAL